MKKIILFFVLFSVNIICKSQEIISTFSSYNDSTMLTVIDYFESHDNIDEMNGKIVKLKNVYVLINLVDLQFGDHVFGTKHDYVFRDNKNVESDLLFYVRDEKNPQKFVYYSDDRLKEYFKKFIDYSISTFYRPESFKIIIDNKEGHKIVTFKNLSKTDYYIMSF